MTLRTRKAQQVPNTPKTPAPTTPSSTKLANDDELVNNLRHILQEEFEVHEREINDMIKSNME